MHPAGRPSLRRTHIPALKSSRKDCWVKGAHKTGQEGGEEKRGDKKGDRDRGVVLGRFLLTLLFLMVSP